MWSLVWLLMLLVYSTLVTAQNPSPDYVSQTRFVFILAGESNMAGQGGVVNNTWDGFVPHECQSHQQILRLNAALTWETAREPLHQDIDFNKTCGIGPGMSFAYTVLERRDWSGVIGLVPCAIGGTKLSEWSRGSILYNQMLTRAQAAMRDGFGNMMGLLWYQGESDTYNSEDAESYQTRFKQFIADVRADLHDITLPVIQVLLDSGEGKFIDTVKKAQLEVNHTTWRCPCVDSKGLEHQPDQVQLTTAAQVIVGKLMADTFFQIPNPLPSPDD